MILIIGLGNPGPKYKKTRHNLGFRAVDALASEQAWKFEFKKKLLAEVAANAEIILAKPQTFMNESGRAAAALKKFYKIPLKNIVVVYDEVDLLFGKVRLSGGGGTAGHRGAASVAAAIGREFWRLRIGVENRDKYRVPKTDDYVLMNFTPAEEKDIKEKIVPKVITEINNFIREQQNETPR